MAQYIGYKRSSAATGALPTTSVHGGRPAATIALRRRVQTGQNCTNLKLTILCGIITVLVFRGTIGTTYFSPNSELDLEIKRIIEEIRSGYDDDDNDGVDESMIASNETYSLGPKIRNWDRSRRKWLHENRGFPSNVKGKPRILLVSGSQSNPCRSPIGDHYLLKSIKNKIDYCRIHDIEIVYNMANLDEALSGHWSKLPVMRKLMISHPEIEWLWWIDSDAFFTDMSFQIPISKYQKHNMVVHGYHGLLIEEKSWIALSTGSFLLRNCQWSLDLMDSWVVMGPKGRARKEAGKILTANLKGRPDFEADDQSALIHLLIANRNQWKDKVFLESSYSLHGYWEGASDQHAGERLPESDDNWPFVTHFVGCAPCRGAGAGDYSLERCLKGMEKAFNFADNQVLGMLGYSHRGLVSPNVKKIRNESSRPLEIVNQFRVES